MTPRDLDSIQAHIDRAEHLSVELWKANDLTLHMCDGTVRTGQAGLLGDVRNDLGVLRGVVVELRATLRHCVDAHDTGRSEPAQIAYERAKNTLEDFD